MGTVTFEVEGVEGEFACDADELRSYRTVKQLAMAEARPEGLFEALERVYMGRDEEYVERVGGFDRIGALNDAAVEAARAKNSSASPRPSKGVAAKR